MWKETHRSSASHLWRKEYNFIFQFGLLKEQSGVTGSVRLLLEEHFSTYVSQAFGVEQHFPRGCISDNLNIRYLHCDW